MPQSESAGDLTSIKRKIPLGSYVWHLTLDVWHLTLFLRLSCITVLIRSTGSLLSKSHSLTGLFFTIALTKSTWKSESLCHSILLSL